MNEMKTSKKSIWFYDTYKILYDCLTEQFGPYENWDGRKSPSFGRENELTEFFDAFAKVVGAKSGEAVRLQMEFGVETHSKSTPKTAGQLGTTMKNKVAAEAAGFIDYLEMTDIPTIIVKGFKI